MADIWDVIVYDEHDAYIRFMVVASAAGNAIKKAREKIRRRMSQIPKDRDRSSIIINVRRITGLFEGTEVAAFPDK